MFVIRRKCLGIEPTFDIRSAYAIVNMLTKLHCDSLLNNLLK